MERVLSLQAERVRRLIRRQGVLRSGELAAHGIPREYLKRLVAQGIAQRPARGIYVLAEAKPIEQ